MVAREIVFNIAYSPVFEFLKKAHMNIASGGNCSSENECHGVSERPSIGTLAFSGVDAGIISSLVFAPIDISQAYYRNSRQVWHWWNESLSRHQSGADADKHFSRRLAAALFHQSVLDIYLSSNFQWTSDRETPANRSGPSGECEIKL